MFENLDVFFSGLDAQLVEFTLASGEKKTVRGYFDNAFFDTHIGESIMDTTQPRFTCKASDLAGVVRENLATIGGKAFSVVQIQPEGTGLAVVALAHE